MSLHTLTDPDERRQLDRLVDGELSEPERTALLARLEHEPEGWRALALSFLEAQCLQETLYLRETLCLPETVRVAGRPESSDTRDEILPVEKSAPAVIVRNRNWKPWMSAALAMAASFLLAFTLGVVLRGNWKAPIASAPAPQDAEKAFVDAIASRQAIAAAQRAHQENSPSGEQSQSEPLDEPWLAVGDSPADGTAEFWLPVDMGDGSAGARDETAQNEVSLDENVSRAESTPAIPASVVESLRRLGHEVQSHHSLWPVDLRDGKRALVPVEEVEIRYVGHEYQ